MPRYRIVNKKLKLLLAEAELDGPEDVFQALAEATGRTAEAVIRSLGKDLKEAHAALEIIRVEEVDPAEEDAHDPTPLPRRPMFA